MIFTHPNVLYFVWLSPVFLLLFIYGEKRRTRIMKRYGNAQTLSAITRRSGTIRIWSKHGLVLLSMICMIIALAGLHYGYTWKRIERKGISIAIALDCSRSMMTEDIKPNRLKRAKWEIRDFLNMLHGDKVGLIAFAGTAFLQCPITLDYSGFGLFLRALSPESMPVGGTDLGAAIETAIKAFDPEESSEKAIILITDGEKTTGNPIKAAKKAASKHIKIFCIGVGNSLGAPIPGQDKGFVKNEQGAIVLSKLDEQTLRQIAAITGGAYVRSTTGNMELSTIYKEIRKTMKASVLSEGKKKTSIDRYTWLLTVALATLLADLLIVPRNTLFAFLLVVGMVALPRQARANPFATPGQQGIHAYTGKKYPAAKKYFLKAQVDEPENPAIAYNLGNTAYREGHFKEAEKFFDSAAKTRDLALRHKALYNRGNALFRIHKLDDALKSYEKADKLDPKDQDTKTNIAFVKKILKQQKKQHIKQNNKKKNQKGKKQGRDKQQQPDTSRQSKDKQGDNNTQRHPVAKKKKNDKKNPAARHPDQGNQKPTERPNSPKIPESIDQKNLPRPEKQQGASGTYGQEAKRKKQNKPTKESPAAALDRSMLNRLKDHPGQALIPRYEKRTVRKDW